MAKRMGRALLAAMKKEAPIPAGRGEGLLGNPQRRRVFQMLCLHPCASIAETAKALDLSPATVRFHARRLVEGEYLLAAGQTFLPAGLIDAADVPLFEALGTVAARRVLAAAYRAPGTPMGELADAVGMSRQGLASLLDTFDALGLTTRVGDGKFTRVYPTRRLEERRDAHAPWAKRFGERIVRRLSLEGEKPEVLRHTSTELQVRFGRPPARAVLEVPLEPFSAVLLGS